METLLEMMKKYPLLSSWDSNTRWSGFLSVNDDLLRITIKVPKYPLVVGGEILGDKSTLALCASFNAQIKNLFSKKSLTLVPLLDAFVDLIQEKDNLNGNALKMEIVNDQFYSVLMKELEEIGLENIVHLSDNYREIHVKFASENGRMHLVKYHLHSKYPDVSLKVNFEMPSELENFVWPNRVAEANRLITQYVCRFDQFWKEMETLDAKLKVIDPLRPNRSHCYRRIMLTNSVNLHLDVNPLKPKGFPEMSFSGPEKIVGHLESILQKNCKQWDEEKSLLDNLESVLESQFLEKGDEVMDEGNDSMNCIVCLTHELGNNTPGRRCECGAQYHNQCLYELFLSEFSTNVKRSVDCPMCGMELKILVIPD